ncbi:MAG: MBL fold metallo-hydrolase, partial [Euryarchaeota archaeon]|nr:MBL fold metallo-hydrolase [Euryarchaeota archaeon]
LKPKRRDHLVQLEILPRVEGLYKDDRSQASIDGVILSHAHMDHGDSIRYLRDDLPIFGGEMTREIILAREFSGRPPSEYPIGKRGQKTEKECCKDFAVLDQSKGESIGDLTVTQYAVDHSVPGARGTVLESGEVTLVYTGDIRTHGRRGDLTGGFLEAARKAEPDVLLIEGTNMLEGRMNSEEDVLRKSKEVAEKTKGLVLVGFSNADLDRMKTFHEVASDTGRSLVLSAKQAYILHHLAGKGDEEVLSLSRDKIGIFMKDKKKRGMFEEELDSVPGYDILDASEVNRRQSETILAFGLYDMNETFEIDPAVGSSYILSQSEPFNEEMEITYDKLCCWLEHLGLPLYQIHASGHARPYELKEMISEMSPKMVIPVHTSNPKLYSNYISDLGVEVTIPEKGGTIEVG